MASLSSSVPATLTTGDPASLAANAAQQDGVFFDVPFDDLPGNSQEFGSEGIRIRRPIRCWFNDRLKVVNDALGSVVVNLPAQMIRRRLPAQYPNGQLFRLYCQSVTDLEGRGTIWNDGNTGEPVFRQGQGASDGMAFMSLNYAMPPYIVASDAEIAGIDPPELARCVERIETSDMTTVPLPGTALKWVSDNKTIAESLYKLFPSKEIRHIWHDVPKVPWAAIDACLGKTNAASFDGTAYGYWNTYAPETLLCLNPTVERIEIKNPYNPVPFPGGFWCLWRITYKFLFRAQTHNKLYRLSTNAFESVVEKFSGAKPFPTADFSSLFRMA